MRGHRAVKGTRGFQRKVDYDQVVEHALISLDRHVTATKFGIHYSQVTYILKKMGLHKKYTHKKEMFYKR